MSEKIVETVRRILNENAEKLHKEVDWIAVYGELQEALRLVDKERADARRRASHAKAKRKWRAA